MLRRLNSRTGQVLRPVLLGAVLLLGVRYFWVMQMQMPQVCRVEGLSAADRVLVDLTAYGLRLPGESIWGYHRLGHATPSRGHYVAYRTSPDAPIAVGICRALPADTLYFDPVRRKVLPARTSPDAEILVIPGRDRPIEVTPHNARLLHFVMRHHEKCRVVLHNGTSLTLDGRPLPLARFSDDYYCLETAPGLFTLVPHVALVGRLRGKLFVTDVPESRTFKFYAPLP